MRAAKQLVSKAIAGHDAVFGDFVRCAVSNQIHIDVAAPILDADNHPIAVLILRTDPEQYLYPLIRSWPTPSRGAEPQLIGKDGDCALFLEPDRRYPGPTLTLRIPLSRGDVLATRAALGQTGEFEGPDSFGVEVLADILPVQESPWFMVAKIDRDEIFAGARQLGRYDFSLHGSLHSPNRPPGCLYF